MTGTDKKTGEDKTKTSIVDYLKRQKEVILLVLFFAGGIVFLYVNFVTQTQVQSLRCTLDLQTQMLGENAKLQERQRQSSILTEEVIIMSRAVSELRDHERELVAHLEKTRKEDQQAAEAINRRIADLVKEMGEC